MKHEPWAWAVVYAGNSPPITIGGSVEAAYMTNTGIFIERLSADHDRRLR